MADFLLALISRDAEVKKKKKKKKQRKAKKTEKIPAVISPNSPPFFLSLLFGKLSISVTNVPSLRHGRRWKRSSFTEDCVLVHTVSTVYRVVRYIIIKVSAEKRGRNTIPRIIARSEAEKARGQYKVEENLKSWPKLATSSCSSAFGVL